MAGADGAGGFVPDPGAVCAIAAPSASINAIANPVGTEAVFNLLAIPVFFNVFSFSWNGMASFTPCSFYRELTIGVQGSIPSCSPFAVLNFYLYGNRKPPSAAEGLWRDFQHWCGLLSLIFAAFHQR